MDALLQLLLLLLLCAILVASMAGLSVCQRGGALTAECLRKVLHVEMGLVTLSFPWLFAEPWPVVTLAALALVWFTAVRRIAMLRRYFGEVLTRVARPGWGEAYFAAGACLTFLLADGAALFFCLPMAILTFADTAAALVGQRLGHGPGAIRFADKSLAGCTAFFGVALACGLAGLWGWAGWDAQRAWGTALLLAFTTTGLELVARRGADNLLIPLGGAIVLRIATATHPAALLIQLALGSLAVMWAYRRHVGEQG